MKAYYNERDTFVAAWLRVLACEGHIMQVRPVPEAQSGIQPLAYGVPARLGRLRGFGNALVPSLAAEFVAAIMEVLGDERCRRKKSRPLQSDPHR